MGRSILLLTACWTFTVLPSLCTSGVLVHPCDCDSPSGCTHETECSDDPCCATVVRPDSPLQMFDLHGLAAAPLHDTALFAGHGPLRSALHLPIHPLDKRNHGYADSNLPLLI